MGGRTPRLTEALTIERITVERAHAFFARHHYAGGVSCLARPYALIGRVEGGLALERVLGVCAFNVGSSQAARAAVLGEAYRDQIWDLSRMALAPDTPWCFTRVLSAAIRAFVSELAADGGHPPVAAITAYADPTFGHAGGGYQAASFLYTGTTRNREVYYLDAEGRMRQRRNSGRNVSIAEARARGWQVCYHERKHRYVKILGTPMQRKTRLKALQYEILPYPKE